MKISNMLMLLVAIVIAFKVPSWLGQNEMQSKYGEQFVSRINESIKNTACVRAGPFPYSSRRPVENSDVIIKCEKCEILYQAGLLSKEEVEYTDYSAMQEKIEFDTRYELTDLGASIFIHGAGKPYGDDPSRFCFGEARVDRITRISGPVQLGGNRNVGIRYVAVLENPHPLLQETQATLLGIPLPQGDPALYPEANVTAVFYGGQDDFELDFDLQIQTL